MRSGFYLSPCGEHIFEIKILKQNVKIVFNSGSMIVSPTRASGFLCWHYLGE